VGSLADYAAYCWRMAEAPDTPPEHRDLWIAQADEIDRYLAGDPDVVQGPTPEETGDAATLW
jgi:hypothetical protein